MIDNLFSYTLGLTSSFVIKKFSPIFYIGGTHYHDTRRGSKAVEDTSSITEHLPIDNKNNTRGLEVTRGSAMRISGLGHTIISYVATSCLYKEKHWSRIICSEHLGDLNIPKQGYIISNAKDIFDLYSDADGGKAFQQAILDEVEILKIKRGIDETIKETIQTKETKATIEVVGFDKYVDRVLKHYKDEYNIKYDAGIYYIKLAEDTVS